MRILNAFWLLIRNLFFVLLLPGTVAGWAPGALAPGRPVARGPWFVPALVLLAIGLAIFAWCVWDFATFGRGTLAPVDAPRRLVVRGLYRFVRNPMYVGVLTVLAGRALLVESRTLAIYGLLVALGF